MTAAGPAAPPDHAGGRPVGTVRRADASMTLLIEVMERPLDPGYAEAAARRREAEAAGTAGAPLSTRVWVALLAVLLGLMTAAAARQLRAPQPGMAAARTLLEQQVAERSGAAADLRERADELSTEIEELQRTTLATQDPELLDVLALDRLVNGSAPVSGPGLVVSLTDGGAGLSSGADPDARVRDYDLQTVVNALWAAGAEAISVDDQRLTTMSAVRNAGDAVLVDLVPLPGPTYVVRAIGDPERMQTEFARSDAAAYLQALGSAWGISSSVVTQSRLELPGVGAPTLRHAQPVGSDAQRAAASAPAPPVDRPGSRKERG